MEMTLQERLLEEWSLSESSSEGYDEYPNDEPELMTLDISKENVDKPSGQLSFFGTKYRIIGVSENFMT